MERENGFLLNFPEVRSTRQLTINAQLYSLRDTWRNSVLNLNKRNGEWRRREVKIIDYSH